MSGAELLSVVIQLSAVFAVIWLELSTRRAGVTPAPTLPAVARIIMEECPAQVEGDIMELGSGWGGLALKLSRRYPANRIIAWEMSPLPFFVSWLRVKVRCRKNIVLKHADFFSDDFSGAGLIVCYLSNSHMARLEPKFLLELKTGATVVSSAFFCPNWLSVRSIDVPGMIKRKVFVYVK